MSSRPENVGRRLGLGLAAVAGVTVMIAAGTSITTTLARAPHRAVAGATTPAPAEPGGAPARDPAAGLKAAAAAPTHPPLPSASSDQAAPPVESVGQPVGRLRARPASVSNRASAAPHDGEPAPRLAAPATEEHDRGD
jgi:hypothetical protein